MKSTFWLLPLAALLLAACGGSAHTYPVSGPGGATPGVTVPPQSPPSPPPANWTMSDNAILTTGLAQQSPTLTDSFNSLIPLAHLGVSTVTRGYELTTPVNTPISLSVIASEPGNVGIVNIWLGHSEPSGVIGAESIFDEGMSLEGPALSYASNWWHTAGDGTVMLSVRGSLVRDQMLVFAVGTSFGMEVIAVRLKIGALSDLNISSGVLPPMTAGVRKSIYSSDADGFGRPAIAVSGDRYSVTAYDVDAACVSMRRWLQYNAQTDIVTGGESPSPSPDSGSWRDQEIAALNNVLAVAYTGDNQVRLDISLDGGATFGMPEILNEHLSVWMQHFNQRLVQVAIAPDYKIGVMYWRGGANYISAELCLAEATPMGLDANQTPTGYSFAAPWVVHKVANYMMVPTVMDLEYSSGGDLVIGYGYVELPPGWQIGLSSFRCAIRTAAGTVTDTLLDSETGAWTYDPSVALIGSGSTMQVFYAYEKSDGITVRELRDGGAVQGNVLVQGGPGAYLPSVHARMQSGLVRVDLLYLSPQDLGWSLKCMHWDDFTGGFTNTTHTSLFESSSQAGGTPPSSGGAQGRLVSTVGWMGYDSTLDGDDVAIALHTRTVDLYGQWGGTYTGSSAGIPGMTGTVPAPNANHQSKLEIIVID